MSNISKLDQIIYKNRVGRKKEKQSIKRKEGDQKPISHQDQFEVHKEKEITQAEKDKALAASLAILLKEEDQEVREEMIEKGKKILEEGKHNDPAVIQQLSTMLKKEWK